MSRLTGDDLLWNWCRWCWSGTGDISMYDEDVTPVPVNMDHAVAVEAMHAALPWHERMVIIAEYPQKRERFSGLTAFERRTAARRWIEDATGIRLGDTEYKLYLGLFRDHVERKLA